MTIGQPLPPLIPTPITIARCELALGWLREQRGRFAAGKSLDHEAASNDLGEYRVLWDESRAGIQRLGELAGIDALPEKLRQLLTNGHRAIATTAKHRARIHGDGVTVMSGSCQEWPRYVTVSSSRGNTNTSPFPQDS